jgi:hypothetical protein
MAYLIDSDVFIQTKNLHYGFDFCPAFWTWLVNANAASRAFSIEKVGTELLAGAIKILARQVEQHGVFCFGRRNRARQVCRARFCDSDYFRPCAACSMIFATASGCET